MPVRQALQIRKQRFFELLHARPREELPLRPTCRRPVHGAVPKPQATALAFLLKAPCKVRHVALRVLREGPEGPRHREVRWRNGLHPASPAVGRDRGGAVAQELRRTEDVAVQLQHGGLQAHALLLERLLWPHVQVLHGPHDPGAALAGVHGSTGGHVRLVVLPQLPDQDVVLPAHDRDELDGHAVALLGELEAGQVWALQPYPVLPVEVLGHGDHAALVFEPEGLVAGGLCGDADDTRLASASQVGGGDLEFPEACLSVHGCQQPPVQLLRPPVSRQLLLVPQHVVLGSSVSAVLGQQPREQIQGAHLPHADARDKVQVQRASRPAGALDELDLRQESEPQLAAVPQALACLVL
mmetsp:Transcript_23638/g.64319  ORF Transcript_23638/g.64319 Transcript_23638/m.64319 type:complete len:355 (-) Transcript_23638:270-1334(-)